MIISFAQKCVADFCSWHWIAGYRVNNIFVPYWIGFFIPLHSTWDVYSREFHNVQSRTIGSRYNSNEQILYGKSRVSSWQSIFGILGICDVIGLMSCFQTLSIVLFLYFQRFLLFISSIFVSLTETFNVENARRILEPN